MGCEISAGSRNARSRRETANWRPALHTLRQGCLYLHRVFLVPAVTGGRARRIPHLCQSVERRGGGAIDSTQLRRLPMSNRRRFLQGISALPLAGRVGFGSTTKSSPVKRDYFKELGVRPFINAAGTYTTLTASLMHPDVMQAIDYASKQFVHLPELHDRVGERIAQMVGCEAAMVPSGAAAALVVGTAACITGTNMDFIRRLP